MSTKRGTRTANGRSSIFQDANGEWHGFVTVGTKPDGTPDRRHVRSVRGEAAVTAKVRKLEQSRDTGTIVQAGQQWTVASWVEHVITNVLGSKLAPNTARSYRGHVDKHIKPALGRIRLQDLRVDQVERMFGDMVADGLSAATCERVRATCAEA